MEQGHHILQMSQSDHVTLFAVIVAISVQSVPHECLTESIALVDK